MLVYRTTKRAPMPGAPKKKKLPYGSFFTFYPYLRPDYL
jgi:hypothetical protein